LLGGLRGLLGFYVAWCLGSSSNMDSERPHFIGTSMSDNPYKTHSLETFGDEEQK
jgi:hypothetical protein